MNVQSIPSTVTTEAATGAAKAVTQELLTAIGRISQSYESDHGFVFGAYQRLKEEKMFSALVPEELGGKGWAYADICYFLKELAKECSSTALAFSMHQHLVAANVWKYKKGQGAEELLRKIAAQQLVLVSTGAGDWLSSNGSAERTEGGYLVSARKNFASQSPAGDILVTSAPWHDTENGPQVLHFGIPFSAAGLNVEDNWYAMGMRGTGSSSVRLEKVFVPDSAITLRRPQGEFHPFWNVVLSVAMPIIMSVYLGIAEKAAGMAKKQAARKQEPYAPVMLGEMYNHLTTAQVMWQSMWSITNNFDFNPLHEFGNGILMRKTVVADNCIKVVEKAIGIFGGQGYLQQTGLEKLYRDILAGNFHPLSEKDQQFFTGNYFLGNRLIG